MFESLTLGRADRYQQLEIHRLIRVIRVLYVELQGRSTDWELERGLLPPPVCDNGKVDMILSEMVDEFAQLGIRLLRTCEAWLTEREMHSGREKLKQAVAPYLQNRSTLIDEWHDSSELTPNSAFVETVVTEMMPYSAFASIERSLWKSYSDQKWFTKQISNSNGDHGP